MHTNQKSLKRILTISGTLLLTCAVIGTLLFAWVPPAQAVRKSTRTPIPSQQTPTATSPSKSTSTATRTSVPATPSTTPVSVQPTLSPTATPYATPSPVPTTTGDGYWNIVSSPNVGTGTYGNQLHAVAVVSANDVWAVGFSPHPSGTPLYIQQPLIEHWDGSAWSVVDSPVPDGGTYVELNGVAAISTNDVWAVGHSGDHSSAPLETLTMHWDGASWSIVPSPSPGTYNGNILTAVDAVSSNDVWAVGWAQSGPTGQEGGALTMHWDGASWTVIPNPSRWTLHGVTAISSNDVWAVGDQSILHWNGSDWSVVSFPPPPGAESFQVLKGISAVSADDIWAVGYAQWSYFYGYVYSPLTYHWDGNAWSLVPNAGGSDYLFGVTAIAANEAWAVGDNGHTQRWNGSNWTSVTAPFPGLGSRFLGIAAASPGDVWAVGYYLDGNYKDGYQNLTLIERYTMP